jgi:glutamine amidotransferase
MRVGVIDYGVGNIGSVLRAIEELGFNPTIITRVTELDSADCLILPGVGNFRDCARMLAESSWDLALTEVVKIAGKPLLGICVGMQLLATDSTEGVSDGANTPVPGLNFIPGRVENLQALGCTLRVPHVGWNDVSSVHASDGLFAGIPKATDFYFTHSYAFCAKEPIHVIATTNYEVVITAAIRSGNIWGTQFHPEKSSRAGRMLLGNFIECAKC